jgi:hypothetical protein
MSFEIVATFMNAKVNLDRISHLAQSTVQGERLAKTPFRKES